MTTIYQRLSPLGFAEWLVKQELFQGVKIDEESLSEYAIDSLEVTIINALAFRWLREEKGIDCQIYKLKKNHYRGSIWIGKKFIYSVEPYKSHPETEIACLEKAAEIIEQKK